MNIKTQKSFISLYDSYFEKVFKFCYFRTHDRELSKDLAQQSFLKTWVYLQSNEEVENLKAFVYKVAHNLIIDWYKKKKESSLEVLTEAGFDPIDHTQHPESDAEYAILLSTLNELSEKDKTLIILKHVENMKPREIAIVLEKDVNTITVAIHRATQKLKKILKIKNI
jgi:RNA polymerase sigma-70 factor (ECF subfamily)